jgi:uncharacterized protein (TIGR03067 family)
VRNLLWMAALATGWLVLAGPAGADDKAKDDQKAMQGTWKIEKADFSDEAPPQEALDMMRLVIEGEVITVVRGDGQKRPAKFKLDPAKSPRAIDITPQEGASAGKTFPGIYEISGETLKICFSEADTRPGEFAGKGEKTRCITLKREKK